MNSPNLYWIKSGSYTFLARLTTFFFGFLNFFILIRALDKLDFGVWTLFISVVTMLELIRNGFVRLPLIKFLTSSNDESYPKIITASFSLNLVLAILEIGLILFFAPLLSSIWDAPQLIELLYAYFAIAIILIFSTTFDFVQQANLKFKGYFFAVFSRKGIFSLFLLIYFFSNIQIQLYQLSILYASSYFFGAIVGLGFARKYLKFTINFKGHWTKKLFDFGRYTFGTNINSMLMRNVDTWMLGGLLGPVSVAIYNPAIKVSNIINLPTTSITTIVFPQLAKRFQEEGNLAAKHLYEKSIGLMLSVIVPLTTVILIFPEFIIYTIAGKGFSESVPILIVTMLSGLVLPINRQLGTTLEATGKAEISFKFSTASVGINIILSYVFINYFGTIGAAYGTLASVLITFSYYQVYLNKSLDIKLMNILKYSIEFYSIGFNKVLKTIK